MTLKMDRIVGVLDGIILGSILTMLFLNNRVDGSLQHDFGRWSSLLVFALIALIAIEWGIKLLRKTH